MDITPPNGAKGFMWNKPNLSLDEFENEYSMKKVKIRGIYDHTKEIQVDKVKNGEKGCDIVTPFYTHLNDKGEECGILINRGWVPEDLRHLKMHYTGITSGEITGLLYRGDAKHKYTKPNDPTVEHYTRVDPYDLSLITQMKNFDEASKFMIL